MQESEFSKPVVMAMFVLLSVFAGIWYSGIKDETLPFESYGVRGKVISVEGTRLYVDIADEKSEWEKGLSGRDRLPPQRAMLFVFPTADYYKIWMKGMRFPIDVFWIDEDGYIVDIWRYAMPDSYPQVYTPRQRAKYVLETVAGFAEEYNIEHGDRVYKLPK